MKDIEVAKQKFSEYVSNYDMNNDKIELKHYHSLRVCDVCGDIADYLNLDEEQIYIAKLIGLLHDIGRFEQIKKYDSYNDMTTLDHGNYGIRILFEDNLIRNFIDIDKYDDIIKRAIGAHNKLDIPDYYSEEEVLYTKIIKDADKIDILYILALKDKTNIINSEDVSIEVIETFRSKRIIKYCLGLTELDQSIINIAFIYDLHFSYSIILLREKKYINIYIESLSLKTSKTIQIFKEIKNQISEDLSIKEG